MFFLRLPGSGVLGGGSGSSSGGLGNHGGFDCPGGFFLPLAPLRLKESNLFWKNFLEITLVPRLSLQCSLQAIEVSQFSIVQSIFC